MLHLRETKVQDLRLSPFRHEDSRRLAVPVHDPLGVRGIEGVRELNAQFR